MLKICNVTNTVFRWQRTQIFNHGNEDVVYKMLVRWHLFQRMMCVVIMLLINHYSMLRRIKTICKWDQ